MFVQITLDQTTSDQMTLDQMIPQPNSIRPNDTWPNNTQPSGRKPSQTFFLFWSKSGGAKSFLECYNLRGRVAGFASLCKSRNFLLWLKALHFFEQMLHLKLWLVFSSTWQDLHHFWSCCLCSLLIAKMIHILVCINYFVNLTSPEMIYWSKWKYMEKVKHLVH